MTELNKLTLSDARDALRKGDTTSVELTEACLKAIDAADALNAFVHKTPEIALERAKAADARIQAGDAPAMCGLPIGIKDLFCTKGVDSQAASGILEGFKPEYESTVSQQLQDSGAVMLGKLNMDEFAMGSSNETSVYGNASAPGGAKTTMHRSHRAALLVGRLRLWPPICALRQPAPTPVVRFVSLRPLRASPASNRPMGAARAGALWPLPPRWIRRVR
jgi:hypothetical protein